MRKPQRGYSTAYILSLLALFVCAVLMHQVTTSSGVQLPVKFDTPYHTFRTVVSFGFFGFFIALMIRHAVLVLLSMADQFDRSLASRREAKQEDFFPMVSIIVPAFNEGPCIEASIRSLIALDYPRYEVLVVDDGSTDDTQARAKTLEGDHGAARVVVLWKPNGGKSRALNFGIQHAASDFVATIDGDSRP